MNLFGLPEVVHSHKGVEPGPVKDFWHMANVGVKVKEQTGNLLGLSFTLRKGEHACYPLLCNTWC